MVGSVHLNIGGSKFRRRELGILKMRFSLAVAVVLVGISVSGLAQQNNTFRVKHSAPERAPKKSAPLGKTAVSPATASSANSKDLQNLERQTVRASAPSRSAGK